MKIEIETYDIKDRATVWKSAYILNHFELDFEAGNKDEDDIFIDVNVTFAELINCDCIEGAEFILRHERSGADIDKYGSIDKAFMEYKNALPILLYILIDSVLYYYMLENIDMLGNITARYRIYHKYDVSNTNTFIKMNMLGVPEDGLPESVINKMIEQGTRIL